MNDYSAISDSIQQVKAQVIQHSVTVERSRLEGIASGGNKPNNEDMEARVSKLEQDISQVKDKLNTVSTDVAVIKSNYATKADVAEAKNSIIMWVVSAVLLAQVLPMILKKFGL
ncbi:hypothetical protein [Chromobacterium violaceum]|uniref:DUF1640 domain-containing protein n=1 Tax=Chromobacterium violaceum TaxID=536 RepID=A0A202B2N6_CHRVL|nr:hypothetical protein [Chromobacterium violaceum]OVE45688.1 hypothetical protein CBW21_22100 [Chromobacterium violaceum]